MTSKAQMALDQAINEIENEWGYEGIKEEMHEIMKPILKDLDELEELKKIMGTPIQDIMKRLKVLEILKPFLKNVLEINEDGTEVSFKAVRYFSCYVQDVNGNWNETEQVKKNKKVKEWLENDK